MPIITVQGTPDRVEDKLGDLCDKIREIVADIKELDLNINEVSVFFPVDRVSEGLGEEIIARVDGLFLKPKRTIKVRRKLAKALQVCIKEHFPKALVECFICPFDPNDGFATSTSTEE